MSHANDTDQDKVREFVEGAIQSYDWDPADSDFQRGYLAALRDVQQELGAKPSVTIQ